VVEIVEADCIGCTKCIQVCPVDAIVGAAKHMHTVILSECTGCDLCIPACPVDCIIRIPAPLPGSLQRQQKPALYETIQEASSW
jgi:electron transport complex protein RnfB